MSRICDKHTGDQYFLDFYGNHESCKVCAQIRELISARLGVLQAISGSKA